MQYIRRRALLVATLTILAACESTVDVGELRVLTGPTPIPRGDATGARDITVFNGNYVVSFAVETAPPWGVARGGIVDVALIRDGVIGYDIVSLADFMPNNWSSWPTTFQEVTLEKQTADEVVVRTRRDWGDVQLDTRFHIRRGDNRIAISTSMLNTGDGLVDLLSGYVVWPDGGYLFSLPGLTGVTTGAETEALANWSASYDRDWALALHAPYSKVVSYSGRDRYLPHSLAASETRLFEAVLQIETQGDLAGFVREELRAKGQPYGSVSATIVDVSGAAVTLPALVATVAGKPYAWALGKDGSSSIDLPVGDYQIYAAAEGYSASSPLAVNVEAGKTAALQISDLKPPGTLELRAQDAATGQPLDARVSIRSGETAMIEYFGKSTFFTELEEIGVARAVIAPGRYQFEVSAGGGFTSSSLLLDVDLQPGATLEVDAKISRMALPAERGWYSADLHHHSDVLDGFTEAQFVMRSELASGIDLTFLSDHDSMVNNAAMDEMSARRGMQFLSGTELSPSWAHFNAYPVDASKTISIDIGASPVQDIFREARRLGAQVVHVNHPWGGYGYFRSRAADAIPGGYDSGFDVVEITTFEGGQNIDNQQTLADTFALWNEGQRAYFVGGSDVHDVWNEVSGTSRTYAFVDGPLTIDAFVSAVKAGHSYASQGPIVYPEQLFGSEIQHAAGSELAIRFEAIASNGLKIVRLVERGDIIDSIELDGTRDLSALEFRVHPTADSWFSLIIEDSAGRMAYSNPLWVSVQAVE